MIMAPMRFSRHAPLLCLLFTLALSLTGPRMAAAEDAVEPGNFITGYAAFLSGDYARAAALWTPLAQKGDVDAAFNLATLYDNGYGAAADIEAAMIWYKLAADHKFAPADVALARLKRTRATGTPSDPLVETELKKLKSAAEAGSPEAQFTLAVAYDRGLGVVPNYSTAASWYRGAAEKDLPEAQYNLATLYDQGLGVQADPKLALHWYRKAAKTGSPLAANNLGYLYEYGLGVPQNDKEAVAWYRKAADAGLDTAQTNLAIMLQLGRGTAQDYQKAAHWFRTAAEQGHAEAALHLGVLLANGLGLTADPIEALSWLTRARNAGDTALTARAIQLYDTFAATLNAQQIATATARAATLQVRPTAVTQATRGDRRSQPRPLGAFGNPILTSQRYLALLGYYDGKVDGNGGPKTRAAVRAFWRARPPHVNSGEITPELGAALEGIFSAQGTTP